MTSAPIGLRIDERFPITSDGWSLHLRRIQSPAHFDGSLPPIVLVPGYGMNSFIFGYHPKGTSMERSFAEAGFEVWSANLRAQGRSRRLFAEATEPSMLAYAQDDLSTVIREVLHATDTGADTVSVIGCSLGGSIAYAHLALCPDHRIGALVALGAPFRWVSLPFLHRLAFRSRRLAGMVRIQGARRIARLAMPLLSRLPSLVALYANTNHIDMTAAPEMANTVEDPQPLVNRDIAHWIHERDLILDGVNITEAMREVELPLLIIAANRDGIVPVDSALSAAAAWGGADVETITVGDDEDWFAHACMFVSHEAKPLVFDPVANWLRARARPAASAAE